jgi:hypothetical protein
MPFPGHLDPVLRKQLSELIDKANPQVPNAGQICPANGVGRRLLFVRNFLEGHGY